MTNALDLDGPNQIVRWNGESWNALLADVFVVKLVASEPVYYANGEWISKAEHDRRMAWLRTVEILYE